MLYWVETLERVVRMPFDRDFQRLAGRIAPRDMAAIRSKLDRIFDEGGIQTAGWIPGSDWTDKVWSPIYLDGARQDRDLSAKLFGLIVFRSVMDREDKWITGRFEKDGIPIGSRTYFRSGNEAALRDP